MNIYSLPDTKDFEDKIDGKNTHLFVLANRTGMQIALTDYGARLVSALVPDKHGNLVDVVLGFDSIQGYVNAQEKYHGATIGRFANRIANGKFSLDDVEYTLPQNNNSNCLHGGNQGFESKVWDRQVSFKKNIDFYYISPDGEEGFPGEVKVNVNYELTNENEIKITLRATTDKKTVINLTNHAFFNLNGEGNGDILNHFVQIKSNDFIPLNENQIPLGSTASVAGTGFDFTSSNKIVDQINSNEDQIQIANGFDHTFVNNNPVSIPVASAYSEESGILLEVSTDLPGLHLYTGNFLANDTGKSGNQYLRHGGLCFEAQHYPDSPNQPSFPNIELLPGQKYVQSIIYRFSLVK